MCESVGHRVTLCRYYLSAPLTHPGLMLIFLCVFLCHSLTVGSPISPTSSYGPGSVPPRQLGTYKHLASILSFSFDILGTNIFRYVYLAVHQCCI